VAEGVPKNPASYRDLLRAQADGEEVPEEKLRIFRREEDIIRSAVASPRAFQACGLEAAMFEGADYRIAWDAIQRAADQMPGDGSLHPENVLAEMRRTGESRFGGMAGKLWWIAIESEKPVEIGYALEILVPEVSSRFQLRLWNGRFRALGDRIDQEPSILGLYEEYVSESYRVGIAPDGGRLGRTMEEIANAPPKRSDMVPTGIPQIDGPTGGGHGIGELMVVGGGTNCVSGRMLVPINRGGIGTKLPLKDVVKRFNGSWSKGPIMVRAPFPDGTVRLARVLSASASGVRKVFELNTAYASVVVTAEHRILTPKGWRRLEQLRRGDEVLLDLIVTARGAVRLAGAERTGWSLARSAPVVAITHVGEEETFDLEVEGASAFIAGGVAVHNSGKSYMVQRLARNQARMGESVLCVSAEDPEKLLSCRMIADYTPWQNRASPISIRKRLEAGMTGQAYGAADPRIVQAAIRDMALEQCGRVFSYEAKKWPVSKICGLIRRHRYMAGIRMVIVDYLQAVQPDDDSNSNRTQQVSEILMKLKKCCTECGVALVVMSQYARDEYRDGQEPSMQACKYAGDIENEAEIMCLMWRDEDDNLHAKLPKIKWVKAKDLRYIISTDPDTGNFLEWNDDFAPREPAEDKAPKRGGKRGQP
jgi:replicative DNA helicase